MRRTDEAFKNELFRRYEQYKRNRRNFRMLAATPVAACLLISCLIFGPQLVQWGTAIAHGQPTEKAFPITEEELNELIASGGSVQDLVDKIGDKTLSTSNHSEESYTFEWHFDARHALRVEIANYWEIMAGANPYEQPIIGFEFYDLPESSEEEDQAPPDPEVTDDPLPSITEDEMQALLDRGGTFDDLVALIGEPQRTVGSGLTIVAWDLSDGRTLLVWVGGGLEESRKLPIDSYEFWESPLAELVKLLESCDVDHITVRPSPSDTWEGATTHFTDEASIAAITDKLIALTQLHALWEMPNPVEDQAALNNIQYEYTTYMIMLSGNPRPQTPDADVPTVYLVQTVELLCIPDEGYYLRYAGNTSEIIADLSDWVEVDDTPANELIALIHPLD